MIEVLFAGASLGLASWLHCVGMCGPLMSIFADPKRRGAGVNTSLLLHHVGRISTYVVLGLLVGAASDAMRIVFVGSTVSILSGGLLLLIGVVQIFGGHVSMPDPVARVMRRVGVVITRRSAKLRVARPLVMGIVNGLLPCGVSLSAIIASATIPDLPHRMIFLASFGLVTVPALVGIGGVLQRLARVWRTRLQSAMAYVMFVVGIVLLLRGLSLDVPYASPKLMAADGAHVHKGCCGK